MHHRINTVLFLSQCGKLERLAFSRTACAPCDIDCKRLKTSQTGDPKEEVAEALNTVGYP